MPAVIGLIVGFAGVALLLRPGGTSHPGVALALLGTTSAWAVGSLIAFSAYAWLIKNVRISVVATYAFVNPVVAVVLGAIFLGEAITAPILAAGAAIVVAVVLIVTARPLARPRVRARAATLAS